MHANGEGAAVGAIADCEGSGHRQAFDLDAQS
jgi:hypothetical protein